MDWEFLKLLLFVLCITANEYFIALLFRTQNFVGKKILIHHFNVMPSTPGYQHCKIHTTQQLPNIQQCVFLKHIKNFPNAVCFSHSYQKVERKMSTFSATLLITLPRNKTWRKVSKYCETLITTPCRGLGGDAVYNELYIKTSSIRK